MRLPSPRNSLAVRLALVYGLTSLLLASGLGLAVYGLTTRYLLADIDNDLSSLAAFYAAYVAATAPSDADLAALGPQIAVFFAPQAGYDVRLWSARTGALLGATRDVGPLPSSAALAELRGRRSTLFLVASRDLPGRRYAARPVTAADGTVRAVVEVSRDVADIQAFARVLRWVLAGAAALALLLALAVSAVLARRVTHPLRQVEAATRAIAAGDLGRRLEPTTADEIGRLTDSVNRMAADLARLEAARREFIAKVSHDLRTPLTAIKGFIVNLQDSAPDEMQPALATMDEQSDRMIRLVDDLLALARLQRGELRLARIPVDLAAVARSAAALAELKAGRLGVRLALQLAEPVPRVAGDADRLQQVVVNLLDNALRVAPAGSEIRLAVAGGDGQVTVRVLDEGPGLEPDVEARAFELYFRGPGGGAGLGLPIAREIVVALGGHIWLRNRPAGGAEAGFALPSGPLC